MPGGPSWRVLRSPRGTLRDQRGGENNAAARAMKVCPHHIQDRSLSLMKRPAAQQSPSVIPSDGHTPGKPRELSSMQLFHIDHVCLSLLDVVEL